MFRFDVAWLFLSLERIQLIYCGRIDFSRFNPAIICFYDWPFEFSVVVTYPKLTLMATLTAISAQGIPYARLVPSHRYEIKDK